MAGNPLARTSRRISPVLAIGRAAVRRSGLVRRHRRRRCTIGIYGHDAAERVAQLHVALAKLVAKHRLTARDEPR
jgi:hypothetical protein